MDGFEKHSLPSLGLQHQAALEPWVPVQYRVGDYAHLGERDKMEREIAGDGKIWTHVKRNGPSVGAEGGDKDKLNTRASKRQEEPDHGDTDKTDITGTFMIEAFAVIKNTMYSKLSGMPSFISKSSPLIRTKILAIIFPLISLFNIVAGKKRNCPEATKAGLLLQSGQRWCHYYSDS